MPIGKNIEKISMGKNNEQQELDLFLLLQKIVDFSYNILKKMAGFCGYLLRIVFKYYYLFLIFILAAVAYSYYKTQGPFKTYEAKFTLSINDGSPDLYLEMTSSLNRYLLDEDPHGLDRILQIPKEEGGNVCGIGNLVIVEPRDSSSLRIILAVIIKDPNTFPTVKKALIDYFNNNDYLKSLNSVRIASLKEREKLLEKDIAEIDSLQRIEYFQKTNEVDVKLDPKLVLKTNKTMFYSDKLILLKQKEAVTKELTAKSEIVNLINEFPPSKKPFVTIRNVIVKNITISFLLSLLLSLFWDNRKLIIDYLRKK